MTRTERTYYVVFGLYNVSWSFLGPVYAWFLLSRGLDLFEVNLVFATYLITAFLFEVPTGAVADLCGRKISFVLSCAVRSSAFALYALSATLPEFLFAEFIDAIGTTLASGALDAWAVDGMREEGDVAPKDRFFARSLGLARTLMVASGVAGGYLGDLDLRLPWLGGAAGFALTGLVGAVLMRESRVAGGGPTRRPSLPDAVRRGFSTVRSVPALTFLCSLTFVAAFASMPAMHMWQPRLMALGGGGVWVLGWVWGLLNVASLLGSALVPRLLARASRRTVLAAASAWRAVTLGFAAQATSFPPAAAGFLLQELGFGLGEPVMSSWMNEHSGSRGRATVLSVRAMAFTLGGSLGLVTLGLVARQAGIAAVWAISAMIHGLVVVGIVVGGRAVRGSAALPDKSAPAVAPAPSQGSIAGGGAAA
jgi:MFS family permease